MIAGRPQDVQLQAWADAHQDSDSLPKIIDDISSMPAPRLFHHAPTRFETRLGEQFRDAIQRHADAELEVCQHPSEAAKEKARYLGRLLWALPAAFYAVPADFQACDADNLHQRFDVAQLFRSRLQLAETNQWETLFRNVRSLQVVACENLHAEYQRSLTIDDTTEDKLFDRIT